MTAGWIRPGRSWGASGLAAVLLAMTFTWSERAWLQADEGAGPSPHPPAPEGDLFDRAALDFAAALDLGCWERLAVQGEGRLAAFDTFARRQLYLVHGRRTIAGVSPTFAWLELYFNSGAYLDRPVIPVPQRLRLALASQLPPGQAASLRTTGCLPPVGLLDEPGAMLLVAAGRADPSLPVERLGALGPILSDLRSDPPLGRAIADLQPRVRAFLSAGDMRIVPPDPATGDRAYLSPEDLPAWAVTSSPASGPGAGVIAPAEAAALHQAFGRLTQAWRARDAGPTNAALEQLCQVLGRRGGGEYPAPWRRELEILYNRAGGFTFAWAGYALAVVLLLPGAAGRRRWRRAGMAVFVLATALQAAGFVLRWILSDRGWQLPPLANQYESVLAAGLLAGVSACVLEWIFAGGVFGLAGAVLAGSALLLAFFQPGPLRADITAAAGILNSPILAWHVATVMTGYGMIGMSVLISLAYLLAAGGRSGALSAPADLSGRLEAPAGLAEQLDRCNLVLIQLACLLLAAGVALGAYWADQAWGRWWGWDPKETWALMTLVVYLAVIHVRFLAGRRRRGLWTAALSVAGCLVMIFTWWGVSYLLAGLHSYA